MAPWQDLGTITVCDGERRIGPPTSRPLGLCLDAVASLAPCRSDGDCRSRERCTCAGCEVSLCDGAGECGPDRTCSFADGFADGRCDRACTHDAECAGDEVCIAGGVCRAARCATAADCQSGEVCARGHCVAEPCGSDADCIDHPRCALQRLPGDLREPSPLLEARGAQVTLYLERVEAAQVAIWRATSGAELGADFGRRFRFDPDRPVLGPQPGDGGRLGAPSVVATADGYLVVCADGQGRLRRASSSDGVAFVLDPTPLLAPAATWDRAGLDAPSLVTGSAGGYRLYYGTADRTAIGVAESTDGREFRARADPALTLAAIADPVLWRDLDALASPFAVLVDGGAAIQVFFAARGRESGAAMKFGMAVPEAPNFSIGEASAVAGADLVPWPFDPVFDRVQGFLDHLSELDPALLALDGTTRLLYYRGAAADGSRSENLGCARNPIADY